MILHQGTKFLVMLNAVTGHKELWEKMDNKGKIKFVKTLS